jgi:hypothetical protein
LSTPEAQEAIDGWITKFGKLLDITEDIINGIVYYTSDDRGKAMIRQQQAQEKWRPIRESRRQSLGGTYQDAQKGLSSALGGMTLQVNVDPITSKQVTKLLKSDAQTRGIPLAQLLR